MTKIRVRFSFNKNNVNSDMRMRCNIPSIVRKIEIAGSDHDILQVYIAKFMLSRSIVSVAISQDIMKPHLVDNLHHEIYLLVFMVQEYLGLDYSIDCSLT
jgi:hypothetical protein